DPFNPFVGPIYRPLGLGGVNIPSGVALGTNAADFTIIDNDNNAGVIGFAVTNFTVGEATKFATVTVTRTNGSAASVTSPYHTEDGDPPNGATAPADYLSASGTKTMGPGVTNITFQVQIINDAIAEDDETIKLILSNPTGNSTLGISNATLTIL